MVTSQFESGYVTTPIDPWTHTSFWAEKLTFSLKLCFFQMGVFNRRFLKKFNMFKKKNLQIFWFLNLFSIEMFKRNDKSKNRFLFWKTIAENQNLQAKYLCKISQSQLDCKNTKSFINFTTGFCSSCSARQSTLGARVFVFLNILAVKEVKMKEQGFVLKRIAEK